MKLRSYSFHGRTPTTKFPVLHYNGSSEVANIAVRYIIESGCAYITTARKVGLIIQDALRYQVSGYGLIWGACMSLCNVRFEKRASTTRHRELVLCRVTFPGLRFTRDPRWRVADKR